MVRKLLATTAIASIMATGAFAQATAPATDTQPAMNATPSTDTAAPMTPAPSTDTNAAATGSGTDGAAPTADIAYMQTLGADQYLATTLDGSNLYTSTAQDAETAGEIENFVVDADGTIAAVVVDTGSFLGDEAKTVAIPFDQIDWTMGADNAQRGVLKATREQLQSAPAFATNDQAAAGTTTTGAAGGNMAATSPATGGTMAPGGAATGAAGTTTDMAAGTAPAAPSTATPAPAAPPAGDMASADGYLATVGADQYLSEDLVGEDVYAGAAADSDEIGSINDLVIASSGRVEAFVVGVGGFLGVGEKDVGVPFDNISMTTGEDGEPHAALAATKEQLTNAPTFEGDDATQTAQNNAAGTMAPGAATTTTGAAPMTGTATTGDTAAGTAATGMAAGTAATGVAAGTTATGMATDTTDATASTTGNQSSAMTPVTGEELSADTLMGTSVYGPDNQTIGSIGDIALTPEGQVDAVIVDVGGFLGIGAKPVAVAMDNLQFMRDSSGSTTLMTQFTQDQLRNAPEYNRDTYAENRDQMRIENPSDVPAAPAAGATATDTPAMGTTSTGTAPAAGTTTQ